MRRIRPARIAALLCAAASRIASANSSIVGAPGTRSIVEWTDPFWQGAVFSAAYDDRESQHTSERELALTAGYGWDTGIALSFIVPVSLTNSPPFVTGAQTPRIGGALDQRLKLNGAFRFWGDAYDYFAIEIGAGLPYQSDDALQNSRLESWNFPLKLFGRIDESWIALELAVTDNVNAPATVVNRASNEFYEDGTNLVSASLAVHFYPTRFFSPFVEFVETFPTALDTAINDRVNSYITNISQFSNTHVISAGANVAPFRTGVVLNLSGQYFIPVSGQPESQYEIAGGARWVF